MKYMLVALLALLASTPAFAHAMLEAAIPRVGSTLPAPPPEVVLTYSEGVEPAFSHIDVQDASGASVTDSAVHAPAGNSKQIAVKLKKLPPGIYQVAWRVTAADTHKSHGNFHFTIAP
jgi:methionine-rich copper-binding protein CopC